MFHLAAVHVLIIPRVAYVSEGLPSDWVRRCRRQLVCACSSFCAYYLITNCLLASCALVFQGFLAVVRFQKHITKGLVISLWLLLGERTTNSYIISLQTSHYVACRYRFEYINYASAPICLRYDTISEAWTVCLNKPEKHPSIVPRLSRFSGVHAHGFHVSGHNAQSLRGSIVFK